MKSKQIYHLIVLILFITFLNQCKDPWEDYNKINESTIQESITEVLNDYPELSVFKDYLKSSGLDKDLDPTRSYTLWIPDNDAMNTIPSSILTDENELKKLLLNHIVYNSYTYSNSELSEKVLTWAGKYVDLDYVSKTANNITINKSDIIAVNGIIHILDGVNYIQKNNHELLENYGTTLNHLNYIMSLNQMIFDEEIATQTGVNEDGLPIYDTASALVFYNLLYDHTRDLTNEDSLSTIILLSDDVYNTQRELIRPYYTLDSTDNSEPLISYMVSKDLIFPGKLTIEEIGDTLTSLFGVKIPFNPAGIQYSDETSNGMVYLLNDCNLELKNKILPVIIQGEDTTKITNTQSKTGLHRPRVGASGNVDFLFEDHRVNPGKIYYNPGGLCATKYVCYLKGVNDFSSSIVYQNMKSIPLLQENEDNPRENIWGTAVDIGLDSLVTNGRYFGDVNDTTIHIAIEDSVGVIELVNYTEKDWILVQGSGNNTPVSLDYIKLVPVLDK